MWVAGGKGFFPKRIIFNYFQHDKSEPDLKDYYIVTTCLHFRPNRFCFKPEPHEVIWKSVTAILHIICVNMFLDWDVQNLETRFQILKNILNALTKFLCRMAVTLCQTSSGGSDFKQNRFGEQIGNTVKMES